MQLCCGTLTAGVVTCCRVLLLATTTHVGCNDLCYRPLYIQTAMTLLTPLTKVTSRKRQISYMHSTAQHGTAGTARHSTAQHSAACREHALTQSAWCTCGVLYKEVCVPGNEDLKRCRSPQHCAAFLQRPPSWRCYCRRSQKTAPPSQTGVFCIQQAMNQNAACISKSWMCIQSQLALLPSHVLKSANHKHLLMPCSVGALSPTDHVREAIRETVGMLQRSH